MSGDGRHDDGDGRHDNGNGQQGNRRHDDGDGRHDNCKTYCSCTPGKWICNYFILTYLNFLRKYQFWRLILNLVKMAATVTNILFQCGLRRIIIPTYSSLSLLIRSPQSIPPFF